MGWWGTKTESVEQSKVQEEQEEIQKDVLSAGRNACYKARDMFYACLEKKASSKPTEIASVGLLYPAECKPARAEFEKHCRTTWVAETRFASHTIVLRRLVKVRQALMRMVTSNLWSIWRQSNTEKAQKVKSMILDDPWWDRVGYLLSFTEPIMSMIRFTDMDRPCLGEIYDGIDSMIEKIKAIINAKEQDPEETFFKQVQSILIERWNKMTTPLHLLAFALTPRFYSTEILSLPGRVAPYRDVEVSEGYMAALARLFPDSEAQDIVMVEFGNFIAETGHSLAALRNKYKMDAHMWWYLHGHASVYLQPLAIKVLAQVKHFDRQYSSKKRVERLLDSEGTRKGPMSLPQPVTFKQ